MTKEYNPNYAQFVDYLIGEISELASSEQCRNNPHITAECGAMIFWLHHLLANPSSWMDIRDRAGNAMSHQGTLTILHKEGRNTCDVVYFLWLAIENASYMVYSSKKSFESNANRVYSCISDAWFRLGMPYNRPPFIPRGTNEGE